MSKNILISAYRKLQQRLQQGLSQAEGDALHDAFVRLWVSDCHPSDEKEGEKLLYQSMRRRQISLWRAGKHHPQMSAQDVQIADPPPDTDAEDTYQEIKKLIMKELTPIGREILISHDVNDETYSEIAERLGMQEAAVRMQLSRARKKIREIYKKTRK